MSSWGTMPKLTVAAMLILTAGGIFGVAAWQSPSKTRPALAVGDAASPEEKSLREAAKTFVAAFNKKDPQAVAALWTEQGEYRNESGVFIKGRAALAKSYESWFAKHEKPDLAMEIETVRFLTPDVARVEGVLKFRSHPAGPVETSRFRSLQIREKGTWLIGETLEMSEGDASVGSLAWLLGQWKAVEGDLEIEFRVSPWLGQSYLKADFRIKKKGMPETGGSQIIGADARNGGLRSWIFEDQGQFGEGVWVHDGHRWDLEVEVLSQGGSVLRSVQVFSPIDKDAFLWQAIERSSDGARLPDTKPLKFQRVP